MPATKGNKVAIFVRSDRRSLCVIDQAVYFIDTDWNGPKIGQLVTLARLRSQWPITETGCSSSTARSTVNQIALMSRRGDACKSAIQSSWAADRVDFLDSF